VTAAIEERFAGELASSNVLAARLGYERARHVVLERSKVPAARSIEPAAILESVGPGSSRGYETSGWRTSRPVFHHELCNGCDLCAVYCPEGVISGHSRTDYEADYGFCKGCGICAEECPVKDIEMVPEGLR
jgi:2-oxoacid:acceptor oxidoreductase delta subunit (pyruvate/2-ketoisovalerate family)